MTARRVARYLAGRLLVSATAVALLVHSSGIPTVYGVSQ